MNTSSDNGLQLIAGPSGSYYYFEQEILERVQKMEGVEYDFIYLLPVKRAVRYFKEDLIARCGRRALITPPVFTFYEFMIGLYQEVPRARKIISPAMKLFLVEETLKRSVAGLRFFNKSSATRRGLVQKVDGLLTELREYGYRREDLEEFLEETDHRIHDFALLIEKFEEMLGDRLMDEAGAIQEVFNYLDEGFWKSRFPQVKTVYLNGYGLFTRPMYHFFDRIRQFCSVKIKLDYVENRERIFGHVTPAYHMLQGLNPLTVQDEAAGSLETHLFRNDRTDSPPVDLQRDILIQPATNRAEEVAFLANYVKRLHHSQQIPLQKIGITFPSLERYAPLIHEIFPKYGIPYNISTGFQLSQSPLIRSFLLFLEVPLLRYDVKKMVQLISSPFFQSPQSGKEKLNEGRVKDIAQLLRLTFFHPKWEDALERQLQYLKEALDKSGEDGFDRRHIEELIHLLEGGVLPLRELLSDLQNLDKRLTVGEFRDGFLGLLEKYGFLDWYRVENPHISPREIEQEYRAFNRFVKLLDQFSWVITNLPGKQKLTLSDFHQYLSLLVSHATYNLREWSNHGLQIMPRLEILSVEPEVLIFGGMVEGDFPRPFTQDVFFHDEEREQLGLIATEDLLGQDRYMFYQILSANSRRLVFTYPRFENESARVPSNLLNILADQFKVRWRRQVPSEKFLRHPQKLVERVSSQIPPGIGATEEIQLRQWRQLQQDNPAALSAIGLWTQRIHINYEKRRPQQFGVYEGVLDDDSAKEIASQFNDRPYSITRLESFAFCPIQFYLRYVLGLRPDEEMETGLTALERGQLVHSTLFRFYKMLQEEGRLERPWEARDELLMIAREEFERLPFRGLLFDLEKERYLGHAGYNGIWDAFLVAEEAGIEESGFTPAYFEMAFGKAGGANEQDAASISEPITLERDGKMVQIVGKIDRIDTNAAGQAMLLDYKTGAKGWRAVEVQAGLTLQLPLYARIIQRLAETGENLQLAPVATAIFQVKSVEDCKRIPLIYDAEAGLSMPRLPRNAALPNKDVLSSDGEPISYAEMLERVEAYIFQYVDGIENAQFRHTRFPTDAACDTYCDFRRMCRKDLRKLSG